MDVSEQFTYEYGRQIDNENNAMMVATVASVIPILAWAFLTISDDF